MRSYKGLVQRYIKNEKRSVAPIFISIVLTIALITSVVFITQNIIKNKLEEKKILFGDYDIRLQKINNERLNIIKDHKNIKDYALGKNESVYIDRDDEVESMKNHDNKINVYAVEQKFFDEYVTFNVVEGRIPVKENEIILNKQMLSSLGGDYSVGSSVEFNVYPNENYGVDINKTGGEVKPKKEVAIDQELDKDKKINYTIVGIIETDIGDELFGNKIIRLLSDEEINNKNDEFEAFTYLKDPSKKAEIASDLSLKYIVPNSNMTDPFGYDAADVKYPGYDKDSYSTIMKNTLAKRILAAIIVFCFIAVYNTFHASIANRIKVYGIIRAIGGTMSQIGNLIYREALILYLIATPIGLILGLIITNIERYILINWLGLLEKFTIDFNMEVTLIVLGSVLLIVLIAVKSVLSKEGKLTPIEAITDARGLTRNKKQIERNILGIKVIENSKEEYEEAYLKELIDYDKTTFKFRLMKKLFKFEGELAQKNITRDAKAHKLTKWTLFIAMAILIVFFVNIINANLAAKSIIKSDKWDTELNLNGNKFNDNVVDEIKNVTGVEAVYRVSEEKIFLIVPEEIRSETLKHAISYRIYPEGEADPDKKMSKGMKAKILTLDNNSMKLYNDLNKKVLDKEDLDNGGVLLVRKSTNYMQQRMGRDVVTLFNNSDPVLNCKDGDELIISKNKPGEIEEKIYYNDTSEDKSIKIISSVDEELLYSTFNSINMKELDCEFTLLTTEQGLNNIMGGSSNNKIVVKTKNNEKRVDTISELNKICANNNYELKDVVGNKLRLERNIREQLGLDIIFAITMVIMVILNLVNTSNASIIARRKELASMRAIGMSNSQERRMIIGELFYLSFTVAITVILIIGGLSIQMEAINIGAGKLSFWTLLLGEGSIIIFLMIVSNLTALAPLAQAKKFSIVEDLKE